MPPTIKIAYQDDNGSHYQFNVSGAIDKNKLVKILSMYTSIIDNKDSNDDTQKDTLYNRILALVTKHFGDTPFTSYDIMEAYEDTYNEPIKLAAVSTYLARLNYHNVLTRNKKGRAWVYRLNPTSKIMTEVTSQEITEKRSM